MDIRRNVKYKNVDLFVYFVVIVVMKRMAPLLDVALCLFIFYHTVKGISDYSERKEKKS